jgi:hypothetical protein
MSKKLLTNTPIQQAAKTLGSKGGKQNTPAQEQARLENLEKARVAKEK